MLSLSLVGNNRMLRWQMFSQDAFSLLPLWLQSLVSWSLWLKLWKVLRQWKEHRHPHLEPLSAICYQWNSLKCLSLGFLTCEKGDNFIEGGRIPSTDTRPMTNTWRDWCVITQLRCLVVWGSLLESQWAVEMEWGSDHSRKILQGKSEGREEANMKKGLLNPGGENQGPSLEVWITMCLLPHSFYLWVIFVHEGLGSSAAWWGWCMYWAFVFMMCFARKKFYQPVLIFSQTQGSHDICTVSFTF